MVIKVKGILQFQPKNVTKKHEAQKEWKKVAMIMLKCETESYYSWFIRKRFNVNILKTLRGTHVTIISDIIDNDIYEQATKMFNGKEISLYYDIVPKTDGKHWWLRVYCPEAEAIRESIGLSKAPYFGFHMTLGYVDDKYLPHSKYIFNIIKLYDIIPYEPRKSLEEHEIIEFKI
jgi:hypothetical protein